MSVSLLRQIGNQIAPTMRLVAFERKYSTFVKTMNSLNPETLSVFKGEKLDTKEDSKLFKLMLLIKLLKFLSDDYLALSLLIRVEKDEELQTLTRNLLLLHASIKNNPIERNTELSSVFKSIHDACFDSSKLKYEDFLTSLLKVIKPAYGRELVKEIQSLTKEASLVS